MLSNHLRMSRLAVAVAVSSLLLVTAQSAAFAQGRAPEKGSEKGAEPLRPLGRTRRGAARKRAVENNPVTPNPPTAPPPVTLVNDVQPDYLSGEADVAVRGNQNPIIRLGLAQNGVNIIEFPASDAFFMIHPGNSDLVAFDEETAKLSRRSLVLRPGAAFVAPAQGSSSKGPSASISVQMQSGMVVTFLIYPVRELSQNAHRCVVMYNREEVVAARRAAGLAVNLDGRDPQAPKPNPASVRFTDPGGTGEPAAADRPADQGTRELEASPNVMDVNSARADERARTGRSPKKKPDLAEAANRALREALKGPNRVGPFGRSHRGLSLAVEPAVDLDAQTRMIVIAVRNDSRGVLRIVPGNPEIYVQTFDDRGRTLQLEQVKRMHVESTSLSGKLSVGETAYYAVVYEAPILGAQQKLRVSVSQTEAADEPATATLRSEGNQ